MKKMNKPERKITFKKRITRKLTDNSDVINFTLGMFAGLMVINTADLIANSAYAALSSVTYFVVKTGSNFLV